MRNILFHNINEINFINDQYPVKYLVLLAYLRGDATQVTQISTTLVK